jgi:hypothetical protein
MAIVNIDYELLSKATAYYRHRDYQYIEVPWYVSEEVTRMTYKGPITNSIKGNKVLVGSGEQGFLELMFYNKLECNTYYQTVTPCFREDEEDETHQPYFLKLELFCYSNYLWWDPSEGMAKIMNDILSFFTPYFPKKSIQIKVPYIPLGNNVLEAKDIYLNNIEIASISYSFTKNEYYVCGTGLALPRFSIANSKGQNPVDLSYIQVMRPPQSIHSVKL